MPATLSEITQTQTNSDPVQQNAIDTLNNQDALKLQQAGQSTGNLAKTKDLSPVVVAGVRKKVVVKQDNTRKYITYGILAVVIIFVIYKFKLLKK